MTPSPNFRNFYNAFRDIISAVHSSIHLDDVMDLVVWKTCEILQAKGAILRLLNLETDELEISASHGIPENYLSKGPVSSHQVITELCLSNKVIIIEDVRNSPRIQYPIEALAEGFNFVIDVPLSIASDVMGILRIFFNKARKFTEDELSFISAIAEQCACALGKARLIEAYELQYHQLALQTEKLSALGRMAAGIAHEINNPLAGILLYSSNMTKKVSKDDPLKEGLDIIIEETIRCRKIIQELLDFSRGREPQKVPANINEIVEKALKILENEFRLNRIHVEKQLATKMKETMVDGNQMEQVFVNLLLNAIEAVSEGGTIKIESSMDLASSLVHVEIADNGHGINETELDKIFEPFFSTKPKGTGLGLSVSYGIVHNHEGTISVESKPGEGSRFIIDIPLDQDPPDSSSRAG